MRANLAEIFCNKCAIECVFLLSQQFFRGVFNNIKSCVTSEKEAVQLIQWNLSWNISCFLSFLNIVKIVYFKKWIFTHPISKQNSSSIADWYYFFNDKIIVNWSTIDNTKEDNFDTLEYDTFNQPYDWKSISHFTNKEFRKQNTLGYTLVAKVSYFC